LRLFRNNKRDFSEASFTEVGGAAQFSGAMKAVWIPSLLLQN